jgi:hypothetical protein
MTGIDYASKGISNYHTTVGTMAPELLQISTYISLSRKIVVYRISLKPSVVSELMFDVLTYLI